MRYGLLLLAVLLAVPVMAAEVSPSGGTYGYAARQALVTRLATNGDDAGALYQAAWLAWLAPNRYAGPARSQLRDAAFLNRAQRGAGGRPAEVALAALSAQRLFYDTCGAGATLPRAARLEDSISQTLARAEAVQARLAQNDPVARAAMVVLYLTRDDVMCLRNGAVRGQERKPLLRKAVSLAESVVDAAPEAPGGYLLLAKLRARLAALTGETTQWEAALAACTQAVAADPDDPVLIEMMWGLQLRAGHWEQAKEWEARASRKPS